MLLNILLPVMLFWFILRPLMKRFLLYQELPHRPLNELLTGRINHRTNAAVGAGNGFHGGPPYRLDIRDATASFLSPAHSLLLVASRNSSP
jgi:hypothetical protein